MSRRNNINMTNVTLEPNDLADEGSFNIIICMGVLFMALMLAFCGYQICHYLINCKRKHDMETQAMKKMLEKMKIQLEEMKLRKLDKKEKKSE